MVRETSRLPRDHNGCNAHFSGLTVRAIRRGSIHKNYGFAAPDGFSQFRRELMTAQDLDFRCGKLALQFVGRPPRQAVVAPHRVSVGEDEYAGHGLGFMVREDRKSTR